MSDGDPVVVGLADLFKALDAFPAKMELNVLRGAMRAGIKVPAADVKASAPAETSGPHPGALRNSVRIISSIRGDFVRASCRVGDKVAFYARFVALGTKAHVIKARAGTSLRIGNAFASEVEHPGARANDWMLEALTNNAQAALQAVADYCKKRLTKAGIEVPGPEG